VTENFVIYILRSLGKSKKTSLCYVVFIPEIVVVVHFAEFKWVLLWKEVTRQGSILFTLGRVHHVRHHVSSLELVRAQLSDKLILENKSKLGARRIQQDLVNHVIRFP
jgi:hypothetical protein